MLYSCSEISIQVIDERGINAIADEDIQIIQYEFDVPQAINENETLTLTGRFFDTEPFNSKRRLR